jgi:hypothetical protein
MNKEFIPYDEAKALKELGFDEDCFMMYNQTQLEEAVNVNTFKLHPLDYNNFGGLPNCISAPLYQQAFRWFREKHDIHSFTDLKWKKNGWDFEMVDMNKMETISSLGKYGFESQEKAELACLKKLIEIVKSENN